MESLHSKKKTPGHTLTQDGLIYNSRGERIRLHGVIDIEEVDCTLYAATNHSLLYCMREGIIFAINTLPYPLESIISFSSGVLTYLTKDGQTKRLVISEKL